MREATPRLPAGIVRRALPSWLPSSGLPLIRSLLWAVIPAALSAAFVFFAIKPGQPPAPDEGVAEAWNDSISKLGVWPIYPPEEDVYVGDVWAVLTTGDGTDSAEKRAILNTAARIGHIDLTSLLQSDEARRVQFRADDQHAGAAGGAMPASGAVPGGVRPSLVGFPGVSISHGRKAGTSFGAGWFGWGASNAGSFSDEIHLTDVSTYGVPIWKGFVAMRRWCSAEGTGICTDAFARNVLVQAGIKGTTDRTSDGTAYLYPIELRLVTKVFLAKTIVQRRSTTGERGLAAHASLDGGAAGGRRQAVPAAADRTPTPAEPGKAPDAAADPAGRGTTVTVSQSDGSSVEMKDTYERPIVFGYRAASMLLDDEALETGAR